jgi:hypothetical protein
MRYFLITGFENGNPIQPYIVETEADFPQLQSNDFGDSVRYYEPLTERQVIENLKNGIEII